MGADLKNVKLIMLNEYEKQLNSLFDTHFDSLDFKQFLYKINFFNERWENCRVDIKNFGDKFNTIKIIEYNKGLNYSFPTWLTNDEGIGCVMESDKDINLTFQTISSGNLQISIRGIDFRDFVDGTKRIPVYVDFTQLQVNNKDFLDENILSWHNIPLRYKMDCEHNEIFNLKVDYHTIFDYFPQLKIYWSDIENNEDLLDKYENVKQYIKIEKLFFQLDDMEDESSGFFDFISQENIQWSEGFNLNLFNSFSNFYYNYTNLNELNTNVDLLNSKINSIESRLNQLKEDSDVYFESNNFLFNTIFLDHKLEPNRLLNNLQTLISQLVEFVNNICKKHNIIWWLDGGNLLGAIRHEDFIPWDDDMDIVMMRKDYHHFVDVMYDEVESHNLNDYINIYYRYRTWKNKAVNGFIQMFVMNPNLGRNVMAGVDIFPFDFMGDYEESNFGIRYNRSQNNFYESLYHGNDRSKIYMGLDYEVVIGKYFAELNLSYDEQKYVIPGVEGSFGYKRNQSELFVIETDKIFPLKEVKYGDYMFPAPNDHDTYLKNYYGEYRKIPKNIHTHLRTDNFRKFPNANEIFEDIIDKFKEANDNF